MKSKLKQLEQKLGYGFGDQLIAVQALTHTSYGHEQLQDQPIALRNNERLEFLGDAILGVVISDILLESYPSAKEGRLSKMRAALVNEQTLTQIAANLSLQDMIRLGRGEEQTGGRTKPSILSSALEALIAAVYLDGGFHAVYPVIRFLFSPLVQDEQNNLNFFRDHKTQLQELVQAQWKTTPTYHLLGTDGPDHAKTFRVEVRMKGDILAASDGNSKKEAEQNAAQAAIDTIVT